MQQALHIKAKVLPGHKIEIANQELSVGDTVDVFIIVQEKMSSKRKAILETIEQIRSRYPHRSAEEIDQQLREERNSWDS